MNIKSILNVFSNRSKSNKQLKEITINQETRSRIIMVLQNSIENKNPNTFYGDGTIKSFPDFLLQIRELFKLKLGKFRLVDNNSLNEWDDIFNFIQTCKWDYFLDFLEYIFQTKCIKVRDAEFQNKLVEDINYILQQDGINFQLTSYVEERIKSQYEGNLHPYINTTTKNVIAYPQIIKKEDEFTYSEIILPSLEVLKDTRFKNANKELLEALEHYKNKRYKECITSCCSSIESTIKVIFKIKNIDYNANSTLSPLVEQLIKTTNIYEGLKSALISPATIRNKLGSSHGKGDKEIITDKEHARYQINITAAEIILLIEELV